MAEGNKSACRIIVLYIQLYVFTNIQDLCIVQSESYSHSIERKAEIPLLLKFGIWSMKSGSLSRDKDRNEKMTSE